jgi:DNA adenine methylase
MIYLNRTCYNGLWRVNRKGQFNVPMGSYVNPRILDADKLRSVSQALKNVRIYREDFRLVLERVQTGDFVYLDPPYVPLNGTSSFTSYTAGDFGLEDQKELAEVFAALDQKGCLLMLSNSDTPLVRELYAPYRLETVKATRVINSRTDGRGEINELVVLNY